MRLYLASWFASKDEMKLLANEFRELGIEVTSRWLEEEIDGKSEIKDIKANVLTGTAQIDIEDILLADTVVLNVPSAEDLKTVDIPISSWARGGRHFEAGFQYATMVFFNWLPSILRQIPRNLIIVGHRENVFHYLNDLKTIQSLDLDLQEIKVFENWQEVKDFLVREESLVRAVVGTYSSD